MEEIKTIVSEYNRDDVFNIIKKHGHFLQVRAKLNIGYDETNWEEETKGADYHGAHSKCYRYHLPSSANY